MAAVANPNPEIARLMLVQGADVKAKDKKGRDALKMAARLSGEPMVIKALLAAGADPYDKDALGQTAFDLANQNPAREIVAVLQEWLAARSGEAPKSPAVTKGQASQGQASQGQASQAKKP
jgi:ankyrin repeat protein